MAGVLRRWFIEMDEVRGPLPALLDKQDKVMQAIDQRILAEEWFRDNIDYYYLRRSNEGSVGLWFQYIQVRKDIEDIEDRVTNILQEIARVRSGIEHQEVFEGDETLYSRNIKEEQEFQSYLRITSHIALDLLRRDSLHSRRMLLAARISTEQGSPKELWNAANHLVTATDTYMRLNDSKKRKYEEWFCRIVKRQHWAHFLWNMALLADPHPLYDQQPLSEEQWRQMLGI